VSGFRNPQDCARVWHAAPGCPQDHRGTVHSPSPGYTDRKAASVPDLKRVRVAWTGWAGGPGVSTFFFETEQAPPLADLRTLMAVCAQYIASPVVLQVENTGQTIDSSTGKAVAGWSGPTVAPIQCSGGVNYSSLSGGYIQWKTGAFTNGRESRGKTFLVPLSTSWYDAEGTVHPTTINAVNNALTAWLATGGQAQRVWSKVTAGFASVSSAKLVDKAVVLTSRRT